jgi:RNA polymerase sigma-70 factor (ECF subfamily)
VAALRVIAGGRAEAERLGSPVSRQPADAGLLKELYEKHAPSVYGRCRYLLKDDEAAKDALQEVFARALKALPEFRAAASPTTWIMRIATHHCFNVLRAKQAAWHDELKAVASQRKVEQETPDRRELVRALIAAAPEEAGEIAVLYYVDELTQAEIAEATGRSLPTIRKRLREFIAAARGALHEALPGLDLPEGDEP